MKIPVKRFIAVILLLFLPVTVKAEVKEYALPNGLKVLLVENHNAPIATFQIWYRVGSMYEQIGKTGMSHLLEHMMFKGTKMHGPKTFSRIIQRNGGVDNAFTTKDYTMYYQKLASDRINISLDLESDRMANLLIDPKDFSSEKKVVMEERRMRYEDDPQNLVYEAVLAAAFENHPYRWPVIGWMSDIASIKRDELYNYYRTYYAPDNAVIVIAGDIKTDRIMKDIEDTFGKIKRGADVKTPVIEEPGQLGKREVFVKKEAELPYFLSAYHVPDLPSKDGYALDVLATILAGGKSSRFYKSLVYEKQIALGADAGYDGLHKNPFLFFLSATAAPDKSIEEVRKALYEEVDRIKKEPPTGRELQRAKNQIETSFIMGEDSIFFQAEILGTYEMIGDWHYKDEYLKGIRAVTSDDVMGVARRYLVDDNMTMGILIPQRIKAIGDQG